MSLLSRLDSKFGRYAMPNVTVVLIAGQVLMMVAYYLNPTNAQNRFDVLERIRMYPDKVISGEVWRLVTFVFDPPVSDLFFGFFFWYLFYLMGTTLEVAWGTFRYNAFLLIGYFATLASAFGVHFALGAAAPGFPASNGFLYGTVFLAFARLYPDFTMYIFFILPIKIRWLATLQWIFYGLRFLFGGWMEKAMIVASVSNYLLFFGSDVLRNIRQGHRRMRYQAHALKAPPRLVHKCRVCGMSSDDAPRMQFRYCSKCEGQSCYCAEHLMNHEHVREESGSFGGQS